MDPGEVIEAADSEPHADQMPPNAVSVPDTSPSYVEPSDDAVIPAEITEAGA